MTKNVFLNKTYYKVFIVHFYQGHLTDGIFLIYILIFLHSRCHGVTRFWMLPDETNNHFRDLWVVELGFDLAMRTVIFHPDGWIVWSGRVSDCGKLGRCGPIFQKCAKCLKNISGWIFGCEKIFPLQSPDYHGESLDNPGS